MMGNAKGTGYGLLVCNNCGYYDGQYDGYKCSTDVKSNALPCMYGRGLGDMEPIDFGINLGGAASFVDAVKRLDRSEIKLAYLLLEAREETMLQEKRTDLKVGQEVSAEIRGQTITGTITAIDEVHVHVLSEQGVKLCLYPGTLLPAPKSQPPRSQPSIESNGTA